jgi:hypothetical protein
MANLPKKNEPLLEQVDRLRQERQADQVDQSDYRAELERPTLKASITVASEYQSDTSYARLGRQCSVNVPAGFEVKIKVKYSLDLNVTTASAGAVRVYTFKLVRSDSPSTILDIDKKTVKLDATGSVYDSVILEATDRPPANKVARYEVMVVQDTTGNARIKVENQYWEVTPRKAKVGRNDELSLSEAPPLAPTNPSFSATSSTAGTFSWTASVGADSYKVYRGTSTGVYTEIATGHTSTSYSDSGLAPGTTYYYAVKATNEAGDSPYSSEASGATNNFDGYIYMVTGFSGATLTTNERFNHGTNTWSSLTAYPAARYAAMGFRLFTKAYVVGGDATGGGSNQSTTYAWDHVGGSWSSNIAAMPSAKSQAHGANIGTDKGYAPGGNSGSVTDENPEFSYSGVAWTAKAVVTAGRQAAGASAVGSNNMYVCMGLNSGGTAQNTIYRYSQSGNSWATMTSTSATARYGVGQCTIGSNALYVMGGFASAVYHATNQEYSVSGDSWSNKTDITSGGASASRYQGGLACADSNKAIFAGGNNPTVRNHAQEYSQSGNSWTDRSTITARYGLAAVGY